MTLIALNKHTIQNLYQIRFENVNKNFFSLTTILTIKLQSQITLTILTKCYKKESSNIIPERVGCINTNIKLKYNKVL